MSPNNVHCNFHCLGSDLVVIVWDYNAIWFCRLSAIQLHRLLCIQQYIVWQCQSLARRHSRVDGEFTSWFIPVLGNGRITNLPQLGNQTWWYTDDLFASCEKSPHILAKNHRQVNCYKKLGASPPISISTAAPTQLQHSSPQNALSHFSVILLFSHLVI